MGSVIHRCFHIKSRWHAMRRPRITRRFIIVAATILGGVLATWIFVRWYAGEAMLRVEASYNAEMLRLTHDYEGRLREEIHRLISSQPREPDEGESADRIFELLRLSRVANNSREAESWEHAPHSRERTSIALKWGKVAADEAAYMGTLHERWAVDFNQGRMPHHISADEVPPFRMPTGWTEDDLKYRQSSGKD